MIVEAPDPRRIGAAEAVVPTDLVTLTVAELTALQVACARACVLLDDPSNTDYQGELAEALRDAGFTPGAGEA